MFFCAAHMILWAAPDPVIIRMCSRAPPALPGPLPPTPWRIVPSQPLSFYRRSDLTVAFNAQYPDTFLISPDPPKHQWVPACEHPPKPKAAAPSHSPLQENLSNVPSSPLLQRSAEVAPDGLDAIRAIISPALLRTSISIPTSDGSRIWQRMHKVTSKSARCTRSR